jgi:hypothetical protein
MEFDLNAIRLAAAACDQGEGQHIYKHPRDSNNWKANEDWHRLASPDLFMELLKKAQAADAALAVIAYMVDLAENGEDDDVAFFLSHWNEGEFGVLRKEFPDVPEAVFIGPDPLHPATIR